MTNLLLNAQEGSDSATLEHVTSLPPAERPRFASDYGRLWKSVPRELGFLLLTFPIVTVGLVIGWVLFSIGVGTLIIWIGLFLLAASLFVARAFGTLELTRLNWAGLPPITRPRWAPAVRRPGLSGWLRDLFSNGHYWLYMLHTLLLGFIVGTFTWAVSIVWTAIGLGGIGYWFWGRFLPQSDQDVWLHHVVLRFFFPDFQIADSHAARFNGESIMYAVAGVIFLMTLPWVARGLILLHHGLAAGVLGASRSEALEREVADLGASRGAAVAAEDHSLRRLERDIHDGPQQRLVRLQFDLASAGRKLESDPGAARALLDGAMQQSRETLEELRELSRGFAPPILQDRGLAAAIDSLAGRSTVPVTATVTLSSQALPPEIERSAYFVVAELLTNAAKHASASQMELTVDSTRPIAGGGDLLSIVVSDDGVGGAEVAAGRGLAGLRERIRGLRGSLHITSPAGGPTVISVSIPYQATEGAVS